MKEIKEMLRDPKILLGMVLVPLLMFPVMGYAIGISQTAVEESIRSASIAVLDLDKGPMAKSLQTFLGAIPNLTLVEVKNVASPEEALEGLQGTNTTLLLTIPQGFSYNITNNLEGNVQIYAIYERMDAVETGRPKMADFLVNRYKSLLAPINIEHFSVIKGKIVSLSPDVLSTITMSQTMMFPLAIMLMLITAMQIAATSIAIEKEEKTLETLLTLPVGRLSILTGKLAGSVVVAGAGAIAALVGVNYYTGSIFSSVASAGAPFIDLEALGLVPSPLAYLLLGVTLFVTIVSALALAICIAVFSENVRSAQTLVSYLILPIVIPSIFLMLADINILPIAVQMVLYAIPYTHSIIAAKAAFAGDYLTMLTSIAYISLFTVAILYIAAKIFTTERVVTARISLKRLKLRKW